MSHASAGFGADLASVGEARRFVRRALLDMGAEHLEFEASQVVTELATNCVIHAATPFHVELEYHADALKIRVSDSSPKSPITKSHSPQAMTGRGRRLVASLADRWGTEVRPGGKTVWCTLRGGPARSRTPDMARTHGDPAGVGDIEETSPRRTPGSGPSDFSDSGLAA